MREIGDGYKSRLEFFLDQACAELPYGADHKSRQFIARQLLQAVQASTASFDDLKRVAQQALAELVSMPKPAQPRIRYGFTQIDLKGGQAGEHAPR